MNRENSSVFKAVIIGGGASGLALSIMLAERFGGESVALIEKLDRVGKKLLQTGNGQCNLSNISTDLSHFHGKNANFHNFIINSYSDKIEQFFNRLGIPFACDGDKLYPLSKQASSVVDALRFKLNSLGVNVKLNSTVSHIKKVGKLFEISTLEGIRTIGENVIVCVGGKSQKHLGTDGGSYSLLTELGHELTPLYPSIVQLKTDTAKIKGLKGLKQKVKAVAVVNGREVSSTLGDLLFTDYGVSGNACFYLSSYLTGSSSSSIKVDFCPELERSELISLIKTKQQNCPYLTGEYLLSGIMNNKIASSVLRNSGISSLSSLIGSFDAEKVADCVKGYVIGITGTMGFDASQVTKGGIDTIDFNASTLESKLVPNLYACGEVLDVDGDCGGFNLKWAFCSAFAVSENLK
ncbi:MAG: aminoacetone oxidase family FAD-binding enzyme [Clostridia bacterium]|nr:aminoacetone oxidase family FAD-binding enzyme [Clostridia bacterium]